MGKFSDSPYFLLKDFFAGRGDIYGIQTRPILEYNWPVVWTDRDYVTFNDYNGIIWNLRYYFDPNQPNSDGSYLIGMECNIVAEGDGLYKLWVKETEEPYKQFLPIVLRWKRLDGNYFIFTDSDLCNQLSGDLYLTVSGSASGCPSATAIGNCSEHFQMNYYDGCRGFSDIINNNREVYWRKDSVYHEWLRTKYADDFGEQKNKINKWYSDTREHDADIRNYHNHDKVWSLFGTIFEDKTPTAGELTEYRIIFDGLKDYVMRAIPEHQRTDNWTTFCEIFFDKRYHEIYNQIKQIWTMFDPMEVDEDFLGYLSKYYHMFDLISPTLFRQREFVRDLIWLLKRKGTYVQFYIVWRTIANTVNALNIYEKWHEKEIWNGTHTTYGVPASADGDTHVYPGEWQEYIYVEKPEYRYQKPVGGADIGWYNRYYGLSGESIVNTEPASGFYNYPVKINANPLEDDNGESNASVPLPIYQHGTEDRILSTHYKVEIDVSTEPLKPNAIVDQEIWDELWQYWDFLRPVNRVVDYNILIAPITDFSGCFVELYDSLGGAFDKTRVMVDLRTIGGWISPHTDPDSYYPTCSPSGAYLSGSVETAGLSPSGGCRWVVKHPLNTKYLHTMAVDQYYNQIVPANIEIVDKSTVVMYWDTPTFGYALIKKSLTKIHGGTPLDTTWKAKHYIGTNEVVSEVHTNGHPDSNWKVYGNNINNMGNLSEDYYLDMDTDGIPSVIVPASSGDFSFYVPTVSGDSAPWVVLNPTTSATDKWMIPHHLYYRGVMVAVYDWNHNQIHDYEFKMTGIDKAELWFDSPVAGYAIFLPVGNFTLQQLIFDFIDIMRNGADWKAGIEIGDLNSNTIAESGTIPQTEIYETDDYLYINVKLDKEISGTFKEFGIYNSHDDLMVYSKSSPIYKPAGTTLVLHFRLAKTADSDCTINGRPVIETCG